MATKKRKTGIEWVGGLVALPAYVTGEGEPYRPETLFWMGAEGAVLGHTSGKPGELIGLAAESLRSTIEQPMFGKPHAPARVRVAAVSHNLLHFSSRSFVTVDLPAVFGFPSWIKLRSRGPSFAPTSPCMSRTSWRGSQPTD